MPKKKQTPSPRVVTAIEEAFPRKVRAAFRKKVETLMVGRRPADRDSIETLASLQIAYATELKAVRTGRSTNAKRLTELAAACGALEDRLQISPRSRRIAGIADDPDAEAEERATLTRIEEARRKQQELWDAERAEFYLGQPEDKRDPFYFHPTPPVGWGGVARHLRLQFGKERT